MKLSPLWTFRLGNERNVRARPPVFGDGVVYQVFYYDKKGFYESLLLALDAETGAELWCATVDHLFNEPVAAQNGNVYVSSFSGSVLAYDREGRELWKAPVADRNLGKPCLIGSSRLAVAEVHGRGRRTWCLDAARGEVIWTFENGGHSYPLAATSDVLVHATAVSGATFGESTIHLFALSARDGSRLWSVRYPQYLFMPVIADDIVVIGARGALLAYALADGRREASLDGPAGVAINVVAPFADGFVLADDAQTVRRVKLSRKRSLFRSSVSFAELWPASMPGEVVGRPVDLDTAIGVLLDGGVLQILAAADGKLIASHDLKGDERGSGGIALSGPVLAVAHGRMLGLYQTSGVLPA